LIVEGQPFHSLRLEHAATLLATTESLALLLHDLADLHRCVEELGCATVEANGLALVELALAVVAGDTLLLARLLETVVGVGHHAHLTLNGSNLLLRGRLRSTHSEEAHFGGVLRGDIWYGLNLEADCSD
jgi:hypothetical protein